MTRFVKRGEEILLKEDDYKLQENESFAHSLDVERHDKPTLKSYVATSLMIGKKREATEQITRHILTKHTIKTTRRDNNPEMWIYKEGIYIPEAKSYINEICRSYLGEAHTSQLLNEVIGKISSETYIEEKEFFNKQNENPYLLPVQNGLLDLKTRKLHDFTDKIYYFVKINAVYDEKAECPKIKRFLAQITLHSEDIQVIQEMIGFGLIREYKYEKAFMLYGNNGRNGKGKLLDLITRFYGAQNVSGLDLHTIEKDRFAKAELHNKLMNIGADIPNEAIKYTGTFKSLTGRDLQTADRKFLNHLYFTSYAKLVFACNELPPVFTDSDAFWLRWVFVEFPYQFLSKELIAQKSPEEKEFCKLQNPSLIEEITTQEELNGFLNFALDGFDRLETNKDFTNSESATKIKINWLRKSNSVLAFIQDKLKEGNYDDFIAKSEFLKTYQTYCKNHHLKMSSEKMIKSTLVNEMGVGETRPTLLGERVHAWSGVVFKNE